MRSTTDARRSLQRYLARVLGPDWEVRGWADTGTFKRPFARVASAGPQLPDGPAHVTNVVQPFALHLYPVVAPTVEDALGSAEDAERLLSVGFERGVAWDDPIFAPDSVFAFPHEEGGGELAVNEYHYVVTTVSQSGESLPSAEYVVTVTGARTRVDLAWLPVRRSIRYRVYRATTGAPALRLLATVEEPRFSDLGTLATSATAPPVVTAATIRTVGAPWRVPLYDFDGIPLDGVGAAGGRRSESDYLRVVDLSINKLHDPVDERLISVVADARCSWRRLGRVSSGEVLQSVNPTFDTDFG